MPSTDVERMEVEQEQQRSSSSLPPWSWLDFDAVSPRSLPGQDFPPEKHLKNTATSGLCCLQAGAVLLFPCLCSRLSSRIGSETFHCPLNTRNPLAISVLHYILGMSHGVQCLAPFACFAMWVKNARVVSVGSPGTESPGSESALRQKSRGCALHAGY